MKLIKKVRKLFLNTCIWKALEFFFFLKLLSITFFNVCSKLFWVKKHVFGDISKIQILAKNLPKI